MYGNPKCKIELTKDEIDYIWLITTNDAVRIQYQLKGKDQTFNWEIRHKIREKLFEAIKSYNAK